MRVCNDGSKPILPSQFTSDPGRPVGVPEELIESPVCVLCDLVCASDSMVLRSLPIGGWWPWTPHSATLYGACFAVSSAAFRMICPMLSSWPVSPGFRTTAVAISHLFVILIMNRNALQHVALVLPGRILLRPIVGWRAGLPTLVELYPMRGVRRSAHQIVSTGAKL